MLGQRAIGQYKSLKEGNEIKKQTLRERMRNIFDISKRNAKKELKKATDAKSQEDAKAYLKKQALGQLNSILTAYANYYAGLGKKPEAPPTTARELQALFSSLTDDGIQKAMDAVQELMAIEETIEREFSLAEFHGEIQAEVAATWGAFSAKLTASASLDAELKLKAEGNARLTPEEIQASFNVAGSASVTLTANASGEFDFNKEVGLTVFAQAQAHVGVDAEVSGNFVLNHDTIELFGGVSVGADIGLKLDGSTHLQIQGEDLFGMNASMALSLGARFKVAGGFSYKNGKIELRADAAMVLGVGIDFDIALDVNIKGMINLKNMIEEKLIKAARACRIKFAHVWKKVFAKKVTHVKYTNAFVAVYDEVRERNSAAGRGDDFASAISEGFSEANKLLAGNGFEEEDARQSARDIGREIGRPLLVDFDIKKGKHSVTI